MQKFFLVGARRSFFYLITAVSAFFLVVSLQGCDFDYFKSASDLKSEVNQALIAKNFSEAAKLAKRWIEKAPTDYEGHFSLAQASAQTGDKNAALVALEQAIKLGLKDDEQISKCANLEPIKSMTAYKDLMSASFPGRASSDAPQSHSSDVGVSIQTGDGKQVVRAGDVVIEIPTQK